MLNGLAAQTGDYKSMKGLYAGSKELDGLARLFESSLRGNKRIRDKRSVAMAFRHIMRRSLPTRKEINALSIAFARQQKRKK